MTSEIAIMNSEAVALAADSAVTMVSESGEKIFTSASKIFALSKYHPIGIMVYGNALFMKVPWETIIKVYRKKLGDKSFHTVYEYAEDFLSFLENNENMFPMEVQEEFAKSLIYRYFIHIRNEIENEIEDMLREKEDEINEDEIKSIVSEVIDRHHTIWIEAEFLVSKTFIDKFIGKYDEFIEKAINDIFERLPLSNEDINKLNFIAYSLFCKHPEGVRKPAVSGVVITGFGDDEIFPSLIAYELDGIVENTLIFKKTKETKIDYENNASIVPFAQDDMVHTFMRGIHPEYYIREKKYIYSLFDEYTDTIVNNLKKYDDSEKQKLKEEFRKMNKKILNKFYNETLEKFVYENFISPVMDVVSILPKDELASLAESFIHLTSIRRRYTLDKETVGGPIDVAVISKGDGFIWIKRKHYFKPELNYHFFENYFR